MRLLINRHPRSLLKEFDKALYRELCGLLVTPRMLWGIDEALSLGATWAADNDCFQRLDKPAFVRMLKKIAAYPNCKFVSAPDVVANAEATLLRFRLWQPVIFTDCQSHLSLKMA